MAKGRPLSGGAPCSIRRSACSGHRQTVLLEREGAIALTRCRGDGVEDGRRGDADGRLADAAPEAAGRHDDGLNLRHLGDAHHVVGVEVLLLDAPRLHRALAHEQRRSGRTRTSPQPAARSARD